MTHRDPHEESPLDVFAEAVGAETPASAIRLACQQLRQRVRVSGRTPGLAAYVHDFGLRVEEAPIPTAGRLDYEDGQYIVRVQRTRHRGESSEAGKGTPRPPTELRVADATNRQRFTIAHEIGHAILFKSLSGRPEALAGLRDPAIWADVEALCDVAAGELLVPLDELLPLVAQLGISMRGLERLADRFRVALEVVYERLIVAGALSLSLWRVPPLTGTGPVLVRVLAQAPGAHSSGILTVPPLWGASWLIPDSVLRQAAADGRAEAGRLVVKSAEAGWPVAGIAACHQTLGTRTEQPSLLASVDEVSDGEQLAADALVTLMLLPLGAAEARAPLWAALTSG